MQSKINNQQTVIKNCESVFYKSLEETILNPTIELGADYAEIGLDQIIKNDLLREVPFIKTIVQAGKTVVAIRDLYCLKKTIRFIIEMNNGSIESEKIQKHRKLLNDNPRKMQQEMESILILLDRENEERKAQVLARFYKLYIDKIIEWVDFKALGELLEVFSFYDLSTLKKIFYVTYLRSKDKVNTLSLSRLSSQGLIEYYRGLSVVAEGKNDVIANINEVGKFFYQYGFLDGSDY